MSAQVYPFPQPPVPAKEPVMFVSAYRQLVPAEKTFVDSYVRALETEAARNHERISNYLGRVIPDDVVKASRGLLYKPMVKAAITERVNEIAAETELTAQRMVRELMAMAFSSLANYGTIGQDGLIDIDLTKCTPEQLACIQTLEIETNRYGARKGKIKLYDKQAAINTLAKFMGIDQPGNLAWLQYNNQDKAASANLPGNATHETAADAYSRQING